MTPSRCPSRDELERLLDERLSPADLRRVSEHVTACGACQRVLESLTADPEFQAVLERFQKHD